MGEALKLHDTALFNGHYYLYHGVGPALMAFLPWRLVTHHDLPEAAALFAFGFLGFLFSAGAMLGLFELAKLKPAPGTVFVALLGLGVCQCLPLVLNRVWVYEVAIGAGYFCVSAGMFCLVRHFLRGSSGWLIPAGFFFGMAVACRPHLGLVGALAFLLLVARNWRTAVIRFGVPFALVCAGVCLYNFERFGNPVEFGTHYLLGSANQTEVHWRAENVKTGLYYLLVVRPDFDPVFPWLHATLRKPNFPRPAIYTLEPIIGALFFAPFLFTMLLWVRAGPARQILALLVGSALGIVLFIAGTGWSVQRYEVDFLQLLVPAALTCAVARLPGVVTGSAGHPRTGGRAGDGLQRAVQRDAAQPASAIRPHRALVQPDRTLSPGAETGSGLPVRSPGHDAGGHPRRTVWGGAVLRAVRTASGTSGR